MSETAIELSAEQAAALASLQAGIAEIGAGFDAFVAAAEECEKVGLPAPILQAKAVELQGLVMGKMMGGAG